jgi:hypothetical protein
MERAELQLLETRSRGDPEVRRLLWEISRLREQVRRMHKVCQKMTKLDRQAVHEAHTLEALLSQEPCVRELEGLEDDGPGIPRYESPMGPKLYGGRAAQERKKDE